MQANARANDAKAAVEVVRAAQDYIASAGSAAVALAAATKVFNDHTACAATVAAKLAATPSINGGLDHFFATPSPTNTKVIVALLAVFAAQESGQPQDDAAVYAAVSQYWSDTTGPHEIASSLA